MSRLQRYYVPSGSGVAPHGCGALYKKADVDARIEALTAEALDWRAQVGELSDKVKALTAALAKADALAREAYFVSGAEPLGHYTNDQVSMDQSVVTDIMTALTAYRQARDATR